MQALPHLQRWAMIEGEPVFIVEKEDKEQSSKYSGLSY
jgi:hypothetical protein